VVPFPPPPRAWEKHQKRSKIRVHSIVEACGGKSNRVN
jgi:hypothetical protein